jgi:hypothetical protein
MQAQQHDDRERSTTLSRPPCGHTGTVPGVAMGPMILKNGISTLLHLPAGTFRSDQDATRLRFNEPPTPRPPIFAS